MIVITGAYGFIGSNLVAELEHKSKEELVLVDVFGHGYKWKNISNRFLHKMMEPQALVDFIRDNHGTISCVIHMGANSSTVEDDVDNLVNNNYRFSVAILTICIEYGIRFIYASSASVYGRGNLGFKDSDTLEDIDSLQPLNAYGWTKKIFDAECAKHNFNNIVGLRFFNVYGPNEYHKGEQASVIYKWYTKLIIDSPIYLFKSYDENYIDGYQERDFVFVQDCIDVIIWMMENTAVNGLFNIGTGCAHPFINIINNLETLLKKKATYSYIDMPDNIKLHYQYHTQADISKLRLVGYKKPMTPLYDGMNVYINQYLNLDKNR